jgi:hypothetical protein
VLSVRDRWSLAFFSATGLPLIVVITTIGLETKRMLPENAAALVGAGMLSVLLFPLIGMAVNGKRDREPAVPAAVAPPDEAPTAERPTLAPTPAEPEARPEETSAATPPDAPVVDPGVPAD